MRTLERPVPARASSLAAWVGGLSGWRRSALAFGLGILASGALPPAHALPLLVISFTGFVWLIAGSRNPWRAGIAGWWFGFGHFLTSIYWIGAALLTDPSRFGWLVVPAVVGLSVGFALFPAIAAFAVRLGGFGGAARVLAFAVAWTAVEWLRGHILTGFPMNLMGTVWTPSIGMIQVTALIGVYGLSFFTVLAAAAPAAIAEPGTAGSNGRRRWLMPACAFGLLAVFWVGGQVRLAIAPDLPSSDIQLRLVQANIDQSLKWQEGQREASLARHVQLSRESGFDAIDLVIWPEAAVTFYLDESAPVRTFVADAAPLEGHLITGAPRRAVEAGRTSAVWNSIHAVTAAGDVAATYDKHHLVPFGEYIPLRELLNLSKVTYGERDFSPGPGPTTVRLEGLPPFSPLVCYEGIFPGDVLDGSDRPAWLLNLTNDGWFGRTAGPYQHFAAVRLRAVEEGLPLVRSANTGISAVVDPHGRVLARLGLGEVGILDATLPVARERTPYSFTGDLVLVILLGVTSLLTVGLRRRSSGTGSTT